MYGVVDFRGTHPPTVGGYPALLDLAQQLVGEPLLFARRGYPDELKLHLGTPVETPGPKGKTLTRGSYVLGAVASAWAFKIARLGVTILSGGSLAGTAPLPEPKLDEYLAATGGLKVVRVDVLAHPFGYSLSLALSDGSGLHIIPTAEEAESPTDKERTPLPDWELFTPYRRFLRVGPGPTWAYLPSDQPEAAPVSSADAA